MRDKLNNFIHSKLFIIILILVFIVTTSIVGTYAWFTWNSTDNTNLVISIGKMADVTFSDGNEINGEFWKLKEHPWLRAYRVNTLCDKSQQMV